MENYIMLDGEIIILDEQKAALLRLGRNIGPKNVEEDKKGPFEKVNSNSTYFYINDYGIIEEDYDTYPEDEYRREVANYYTDKSLMIQRALHETLNRLLWRFSMENGEGENPFDCNNAHYRIYWSYDHKSFDICCSRTIKSSDSVYFPTKELANQAIDKIIKPFMKEHPEFVW